ncbi:hypothetical protein cyc_07824 [Cyclospora cayetanensis]|uniref:Uncharacterized protein n=1 Tax=Cyclospora cayetanensis TaxID=88456 RepID=A0A1D3D903_9EIME|nr:hypothetical protein cyc_07824 [Cyclospora cayetanensis]
MPPLCSSTGTGQGPPFGSSSCSSAERAQGKAAHCRSCSARSIRWLTQRKPLEEERRARSARSSQSTSINSSNARAPRGLLGIIIIISDDTSSRILVGTPQRLLPIQQLPLQLAAREREADTEKSPANLAAHPQLQRLKLAATEYQRQFPNKPRQRAMRFLPPLHPAARPLGGFVQP